VQLKAVIRKMRKEHERDIERMQRELENLNVLVLPSSSPRLPSPSLVLPSSFPRPSLAFPCPSLSFPRPSLILPSSFPRPSLLISLFVLPSSSPLLEPNDELREVLSASRFFFGCRPRDDFFFLHNLGFIPRPLLPAIALFHFSRAPGTSFYG
jgi:hypothetical protein